MGPYDRAFCKGFSCWLDVPLISCVEADLWPHTLTHTHTEIRECFVLP